MIQGAMITIGGGLIQSCGGGSTLISKTITANGVYDPADDSADGYSSVTVAVPTGGASGVYVGTTDPDASLGSNGEYYYKRVNDSPSYGIGEVSFTGGSGQTELGYEFTANSSFEISGFRVYSNQASTTAYVKFGTASEILCTTESITKGSSWTDIYLDTPITVTAGTNYIIKEVIGNAYGMYKIKSAITPDSRISLVQGRYGSAWPGNTDSANIYSADILIKATDYQIVSAQYYKENGAWTQIR